jgi:hypothetical protein
MDLPLETTSYQREELPGISIALGSGRVGRAGRAPSIEAGQPEGRE